MSAVHGEVGGGRRGTGEGETDRQTRQNKDQSDGQAGRTGQDRPTGRQERQDTGTDRDAEGTCGAATAAAWAGLRGTSRPLTRQLNKPDSTCRRRRRPRRRRPRDRPRKEIIDH